MYAEPSPSALPASSSKHHHPYFTPEEVAYLSEKQRGKLSVTQEEKVRHNACAFLEAIGARIGFPRRTVATAQNLYHRFHLFFPRKDFNYVDVSLAALFVSAKMHDTLKKPRELLAVSYAVRFPDLVAKSKNPGGEVDLDTMDQQMVEHDRQRLLAVERLILETICFNFTSRMPFPYVIKIGRDLGATKKLTKLSWRLAIDCHRTLLPIQYPPHTLALGSIYAAALLSSFELPPPTAPAPPPSRNAHEIANELSTHGAWEKRYLSGVEDLEDITHTILDLLIASLQSLPSSSSSSSTQTSPSTPSTPSSPHPHPSSSHSSRQHPPASQTQPYQPDQLIRLKIAMRESEHPARVRRARGGGDPSALYSGGASAGGEGEGGNLMGRNEGTVRFLFGPPGVGEGP